MVLNSIHRCLSKFPLPPGATRLQTFDQLGAWVRIGGQSDFQLRFLDSDTRLGADFPIDVANVVTLLGQQTLQLHDLLRLQNFDVGIASVGGGAPASRVAK